MRKKKSKSQKFTTMKNKFLRKIKKKRLLQLNPKM